MSSKNKKTVSLLLCVLLLIGLTLPAVSAAEPVHISTAQEFTDFVGDAANASANAVLDADIDLGEWTTAFADGFSGTLDGAGHSITYTKTNPTGNFHSLFKVLSAEGVIRDLTVKGSMSFNAARTYNAPFVYENRGLIEGCVNEMTIKHTGTKNCQYNAGIAAKNYGTVKDCVNNADISVRNYAGGIVAQNLGGNVLGCVNNGAVTATNTAGYAGGIIAAVGANSSEDNVLIENCVNAGNVTGGSGDYGYAGGVVAQINIASSYATYSSKPSITIRGCSSSGTLSAGNTDEILAKNNNEDNCTLTVTAGEPAHVHTYDGGVETTPPTCALPGVMTYTCTSCDEGTEGHTVTEQIPPTGRHTAGDWTAETVDGEEVLVRRCTACGTLMAKKSAAAAATLENAAASLEENWFRLVPVYGKDTNVVEMLSSALKELGYEGITVSLLSADNPADGSAAIAENGDITYFYADPDVYRPMWFASVPVRFGLTLEDADAVYEKNAVIHWNVDLATEALQTYVADLVTGDAIRAGNASLEAVTEDLSLPRAVCGESGTRRLWSLITWESSDGNAISIDDSAQNSADTMFEPYTGVVKRSIEDKTVTLTANFSFQYTGYDEPAISYSKSFTVTVKGMGDEWRNEMQAQLDANYLAEKLTYIGSKQPIDPEAVTDDVQLLIPKNTGVENYNSYRFSVACDSPYAEVNAYRLNVRRPLPGEDPAEVILTVTMEHKDYDLSVSKELVLTVAPIDREDLDAHLALMERVKADLFDGLNNGANENAQTVTENLSPFIEAVSDGDGGIVWVRNVRDVTDSGITAVSIDLSHPSEKWDRFRSSDPDTLAHETLIVTRQDEDREVTVTVCLSDAKYARYAALYPDHAEFAALDRQTVTVTLTVKGEKTTPDTPDTPDAPSDENLCKWDNVDHGTSFLGKLTKFFHTVLYFFAHLFGLK